MVEHLETGVEVKKVDSQGRLILPVDWREAEIGESRELYVIKRKGYLKLVAKRRVDLTECFIRMTIRKIAPKKPNQAPLEYVNKRHVPNRSAHK